MIIALTLLEKVGGGFAALLIALLLACLSIIMFENMKCSGELSRTEGKCVMIIFGMSALSSAAMATFAFGFFFIL